MNDEENELVKKNSFFYWSPHYCPIYIHWTLPTSAKSFLKQVKSFQTFLVFYLHDWIIRPCFSRSFLFHATCLHMTFFCEDMTNIQRPKRTFPHVLPHCFVSFSVLAASTFRALLASASAFHEDMETLWWWELCLFRECRMFLFDGGLFNVDCRKH